MFADCAKYATLGYLARVNLNPIGDRKFLFSICLFQVAMSYRISCPSIYSKVCISNHGTSGGIIPMSLRRPSAKSARTIQPIHTEIIVAL